MGNTFAPKGFSALVMRPISDIEAAI